MSYYKGRPHYNNRSKSKSQKPKRLLWLSTIAALVIVGAAFGYFMFGQPQAPSSNTGGDSASSEPKQASEPAPPLVDLQPVVDSWLAGQSAEFGIVVYDVANSKIIAANNADQSYFAASLYKLFVAYLALTDFENGAQDPSEVIYGGLTKQECVDKMIRESHSPCGETMMAAMGQANLEERVAAMGIHNTTFAGITTSAQDSALILQYVLQMRDLNAENAAFLKDAMRTQDQKFKNGLAKGAPQATWESKVGWHEQYNYHDVGIMTMPNGRIYVVAILSLNNGSSEPIAEFASTIYNALAGQ